jgi:hypothetical protein
VDYFTQWKAFSRKDQNNSPSTSMIALISFMACSRSRSYRWSRVSDLKNHGRK